MENRRFLLSQILTMLTGQLLLSAVMVLLFALLGHYNPSVLLGAVTGSLIATLNHTLLVLGVLAASGKAEKQDVKGGQAVIQMSYAGRLIGLAAALFLCCGSGLFNLPALVIPFFFTRPILTIAELLNRKGGSHP